MQQKWEFEEFDPGPMANDAERIHVTVNRRGYFYLSGRAIKALGEPDAVTLLYDRRMQTIAIKRAPLTNRKAFRLKLKDGESVGGRMLHAGNFCRHYGIRPDATLAFVKAAVDGDGLLILSMHDTAQVQKQL